VRTELLRDKISNNLFKGFVLALKEVSFYFTYAISNKLVKDGSVKGRALKCFFLSLTLKLLIKNVS
jgi:hypothetical protein